MRVRGNSLRFFVVFWVLGWALLLGSAPAGATGRIVVGDLSGARVAPLEAGKAKGVVLVFITNDCPIANACAPEIERIYRAYAAKQIRFYLVYVDASLTAAAAVVHHKAYAYTCPAVLDPDHLLVKAGHAQLVVTLRCVGGHQRQIRCDI